MKRLNFRILLLGILPIIATLSGCTQDTDLGKADSGVAPLFISSVNTPNANTRSTQNMNNGTLGVFRLADSDAYLEASANKCYECSWGTWTATGGNLLIAASTSVCAYSPYNKYYNDATQLPLTSWMGLSAETSYHELLYSLPTKAAFVGGGMSVTSFTLQRAYAMLRFTLKGSSSNRTRTVKTFCISNQNLPFRSSINITGEFVHYGDITSQPQMRCDVYQMLSNDIVIEALLPPCENYCIRRLNVTITLDNTNNSNDTNYSTTIDLSLCGDLSAGTIYPIDIELI
jgi:hypothetical protein